jgi:integrase
LGTVKDVPLAAARQAAGEYRTLLRTGVDPLTHNQAKEALRLAAEEAARAAEASGEISFRFAAEARMTAMQDQFKNAKHRAQWGATLSSYVYRVFGDKPVAEVDREDVLTALQPVWLSKPETAARVRGRIEAILDYAAARGWRSGSNPAIWRGGLSSLLPSHRKTRLVRHHPALPWAQVPAFMSALGAAPGLGALALRFAVLTAARSGEVRHAVWGEVDVERRLWVVPAEKMKAKRAHRVPLSDAALEVLALARPFRTSGEPDALVFPGAKLGRPLSDMSLASVIKRLNVDGVVWADAAGAAAVPHGFRSSFRDWCSDTRGEASEIVELSLAHSHGNAVERAYRRSDLFARRAVLMAAWSAHCSGMVVSNVLHLKAAHSS